MSTHAKSLLAIAFLLLYGCQQEIMLESEELSGVEVRLGSQIGSRMSGDQWEDQDVIGVFMSQSGQELSSASVIGDAANRKFMYHAKSTAFEAVTESDRLYYPAKSTVDFTAYYPYTSMDALTIDWDISRQQDPSSIDLLYSNNLKNIAANKDKQVLEFTHQLCKLVFRFQKDEGMSDEEFQSLQVVLNDTPTRATFSVADGTWTLDEGSKAGIVTVAHDGEAQMLVYPGASSGKSFMAISNSQTYYFRIAQSEGPWNKGIRYDYEVALDKNGDSADLGATIKPWPVEGEEGDVEADDSHSHISIWDGYSANTGWYDEMLSEFTLYAASQLSGLAQLVRAGHTFKGKTIHLAGDCNLNNHAFLPIGIDEDHAFEGTFDGKGHTIAGILPEWSSTQPYAALFGVNKGTIKNVITTGDMAVMSRDLQRTYVAGLVAFNKGVVEGCQSYVQLSAAVNAATNGLTNLYVGGVVAVNEQTVSHCKNYGALASQHTNTSVAANNTYIGGVVGQSRNNGMVTGCANHQTVHSKGGNVYAGGVCGYMAGADVKEDSQTTLETCTNYGDVICEEIGKNSSVGGVLGCTGKNPTFLSTCMNYGKVQITGIKKSITISAGGVLGRATQCQVSRSVNKGAVIALNTLELGSKTTCAGGLIGIMSESSELHTSGQQANQAVQATGYCGGLVGLLDVEDDSQLSKVFGCNTNGGTPLKWIGSSEGSSYQAGVTQVEHTDN